MALVCSPLRCFRVSLFLLHQDPFGCCIVWADSLHIRTWVGALYRVVRFFHRGCAFDLVTCISSRRWISYSVGFVGFLFGKIHFHKNKNECPLTNTCRRTAPLAAREETLLIRSVKRLWVDLHQPLLLCRPSQLSLHMPTELAVSPPWMGSFPFFTIDWRFLRFCISFYFWNMGQYELSLYQEKEPSIKSG